MSSKASKLLLCRYVLRCVFSGQWKDLLSIWLTWIVSTGSVDLYCLGTVARLGDTINSCSTVGAVSQNCTLHKQPVILLCGRCVHWAYKWRSSEIILVLFLISAAEAVRLFWPLLSGSDTYNAIMLGICRKETSGASELCIGSILCFHLRARWWRQLCQGWVSAGRQAGLISPLHSGASFRSVSVHHLWLLKKVTSLPQELWKLLWTRKIELK